MLSATQIEGRLLPVFEAHPEIQAAWLFGSTVTGDGGPLSDIDVALLFSKRVSLREFGLVVSDLSEALGRNDVDPVDLFDASPLLRHRIFTRGRLLLDREPVARVNFTARALSEYFDLIPSLRKVYAP